MKRLAMFCVLFLSLSVWSQEVTFDDIKQLLVQYHEKKDAARFDFCLNLIRTIRSEVAPQELKRLETIRTEICSEFLVPEPRK